MGSMGSSLGMNYGNVQNMSNMAVPYDQFVPYGEINQEIDPGWRVDRGMQGPYLPFSGTPQIGQRQQQIGFSGQQRPFQTSPYMSSMVQNPYGIYGSSPYMSSMVTNPYGNFGQSPYQQYGGLDQFAMQLAALRQQALQQNQQFRRPERKMPLQQQQQMAPQTPQYNQLDMLQNALNQQRRRKLY